jgi:ABC-type antimicrobial peptide transport system permease subunit
MEAVVDDAMAAPLRLRFFLGLFALLGLVLGTVGVYGVVSYSVSRRKAEFGIRMALGAEPNALLGTVIRGGMMPVVGGIVAGIAASALLSGVLASFLFGVEPMDLASFGAASGVLLATGIAAAAIPGIRASRTDPVEALRAE